MLAGSLVAEFEVTEDERWCDPRDLQQDLQLAAELGKALLDRNTELEESLQQMYTTNQDQLQEIEHLSKQVELLRQVNEQHAKVYEQLDVTARDLEDANHKLVADSRASQQKIASLTETTECLHATIDHLQSQVDELRSAQRRGPGTSAPKPAASAASLKELYDLRQHFVHDHVFAEKIASLPGRRGPDEEQRARLQRAVAALQAQLGLERRRRAALEDELGQVLAENAELERQLGAAGGFRARALELEAEVAALRSERPAGSGVAGRLPDALWAAFREPPSLLEELLLTAPAAPGRPPRALRRSSSDPALGSGGGGGGGSSARAGAARGHEQSGARGAPAAGPGGVCPLQAVGAQYSALRDQYDQLLRQCRAPADARSHKAVQTARAPAKGPAAAPEPAGSPGSTPPPEYKALFRELFSCIEKTKQEIEAQRTKRRPVPARP